MKKMIAFLLAALLTLSFSAALADSSPMSKEDQMVDLVKSFLEENDFPYEYDDYTVETQFAINNTMEYANVIITSPQITAPLISAEGMPETKLRMISM